MGGARWSQEKPNPAKATQEAARLTGSIQTSITQCDLLCLAQRTLTAQSLCPSPLGGENGAQL